MYPEDFEAVDAYEKENKKGFSGKPEATKESAADSNEKLTGKKK